MKKHEPESAREGIFRKLFVVGVILKGIDGLLETIGGALFLLIPKAALNRIVVALTYKELLEDPDDWIANSLRHAFHHLSSGQKLFGSAYLLAHGTIKIFLVACLLRNRLWSYPTAIAFLIGFIGYQLYRINTKFSLMMVALTGLDMLIVLLIWHEYVYLKQKIKRSGSLPFAEN